MTAIDREPDDGLRLPRPPGVLRRFGAAHPRVVDAVVVVVALLVGWVQVDFVGLAGPLWEVLGGPWSIAIAITSAALLLRRTHPLVPLVAVAASVLLGLVDERGPLVVPLAVSVHALAVHRSNRAAVAGAAALVVEVLALEYGRTGARTPALFFAVVAIVGGLLIGTAAGDRRRYLAAVLERTAQLAEERDRRARLAVAQERARIARELHDVVAHGLSVMVRLSDGAAATAESDPARAATVSRQVGDVGRGALRDMRRLLGVLGPDDVDPVLEPQPGLADLDSLVGTYRTAGLPVVLERSGTAELDPAAQLVVYRAVQEGLTNALRYARLPSRVEVRVRLAADTEVEVADDGAGGPAAASVGSGRGLLGLRERAALYGGSVEAGPRPDLGGRGWRTRLRITVDPLREDPA
ncbi:sensor histidine kinase [Amnibacterium setariae]|uniref:histidine kinase n=1 Tax=Amnibacterium setariae TaxID=2306585 RepID=A0A3A1TXT8_9MICO|nr:histidine kinase [Amnibacterium setariae]RIX28580.1 two-component sensor histidine kinase [Amnibacterium setariae]